ncbi:MAG: endonuclease/exonuclease/phosphatase family protein [Nocardioides sp.]
MGARPCRQGVPAAAARRWRALLTTAAVAVTSLGITAPAPAQAADGADARTASAVQVARGRADGLTIVQANIYTGLKTEKFQKDVATVLGLAPDFVTYNEVPFRQDSVMAPSGYEIHRSMKNRFKAATPVAWRADRWTAIDEGTFRISNWRGKPPGKVVELGRRFANWVTLESADGRVVSVVSVHVAPLTKGMPDLLNESVARLGRLVGKLARSGPVLAGGDFNVHYTSGRYPRERLTADQLAPTYDILGAHFPTGDHFGNTIDYVFSRGTDELTPTKQYPVELKSDHDAVVGDYTWLVDPPATISKVRNAPDGTRVEQRATARALVNAIDAAKPGSTVALRTPTLALKGPQQALRAAVKRGVHVQVASANDASTKRERVLQRTIAAQEDPASWFQACGAACLSGWRKAGMARALLMISNTSGAWTARYDVNRPVGPEMVELPSAVTISTGPLALKEGAAVLGMASGPA